LPFRYSPNFKLKLTFSSKNPWDNLVGLQAVNVKHDANKIKADIILYNTSLTWVFVEQDVINRNGKFPVQTRGIYLLGPNYDKKIGAIEFQKDSYLHFNAKSLMGARVGSREYTALLSVIAIELILRGFFTEKLPPESFDLLLFGTTETILNITDTFFYQIKSNCSGPLVAFGYNLAKRDYESALTDLGAFASCIINNPTINRKIQEWLTKIIGKEQAQKWSEIAMKRGEQIAEILDLPGKAVLIKELVENIFKAPQESWVRIETVEVN
jgi:hypothetical protein